MALSIHSRCIILDWDSEAPFPPVGCCGTMLDRHPHVPSEGVISLFTGLVEQLVPVVRIRDEGPGKQLTLKLADWANELELGESIAINGCCLTVVKVESGDEVSFEAGSETLSKTTIGDLKEGESVNVERALRASDRLGGHWVTGHVDAVGQVSRRADEGSWSHFRFQHPASLASQLVAKGSVAVDGVSLTVVEAKQTEFSVALIPHTLERTTLGNLQAGDSVNLETDILAKYVARQLEDRSLA